MVRQLDTVVSVAESYGRGLGNLILENCQFWGEVNFEGRMNRFKEDKRQFNVVIPTDAAEKLAALGWNVKCLPARSEEEAPLCFLKVMVDIIPNKDRPDDVDLERKPDMWVIQGEQREKLTSKTCPMLDTTRNIETLDMELRAWEWNKDKGGGEYSARLVTLVAVMRPNILADKYRHIL